MNRIFILVIPFIIGGASLQAQDFLLGVKVGLNQTTYKNQVTNEETDSYSGTEFGLSVLYNPYYSSLFLISGLHFESSENHNNLTIPLIARLALGKRLMPYTQLGTYYSISFSGKEDNLIPQNNVGAIAGLGLMYAMGKHIRLDLGVSMRFGITPSLQEEIPLPGNNVSYDDYKLRSGRIDLGINYRF